MKSLESRITDWLDEYNLRSTDTNRLGDLAEMLLLDVLGRQRWIPVKERLPEANRHYLTYEVDDGGYPLMRSNWWGMEQWEGRYGKPGWEHGSPLYWRELPESPEPPEVTDESNVPE